MTESDQQTPEPVPFAGEVLDRCRHVCAFIDSRNAEFLAERRSRDLRAPDV